MIRWRCSDGREAQQGWKEEGCSAWCMCQPGLAVRCWNALARQRYSKVGDGNKRSLSRCYDACMQEADMTAEGSDKREGWTWVRRGCAGRGDVGRKFIF